MVRHLARHVLRLESQREARPRTGMLRAVMVHYNTLTEVERFLEALPGLGREIRNSKSEIRNEHELSKHTMTEPQRPGPASNI